MQVAIKYIGYYTSYKVAHRRLYSLAIYTALKLQPIHAMFVKHYSNRADDYCI